MAYAGAMRWPAVVILLSSILVACGPDKGGGETGSSGGSSSSGASTGASTGSDASTGPVVTTGSGACSELGCGECDGGCVPEPVCVDGEVVCDCANCNESMSEPGTGTASTTGASSSGTASTGGTTGESTGGGGIVCGGDMPVFPEFDRTCMGDGDCSLVFHQVDCCGSLVAWGLSNDAAKLFAEAEAECEAMYPACECATQPTLLDDGSSTENNDKIAVTCQAGSCFSFQV